MAASDKLTWAPPDTTGWNTVEVPATGGQILLTADTVLTAPNKVTANVRIRSSHSVVWTGGHIEISGLDAPSEIDSCGLNIEEHSTNAGVDGRIVHIEGLRIDGDSLGQGIRTDAPTTVLQIQNIHVGTCRFKNCDHRDGTNGVAINHPDILQTYGGQKELRIDKLTGSSAYQGVFLKEDHSDAPKGLMQFRRVNVHATEVAGVEQDGATGYTYAGHRMLSKYDALSGPLRLDSDTVWVEHHINSGWNAGSFYRDRYWDAAAGSGGFASNVQHYGWNGTTVEGWTGASGAISHQTALVQEGTGAIQLEKAFGATGFDSVRSYDAASARDFSANGNVLALWVHVPTGTPGANWRGRLGIYRQSTGALVEAPPAAEVALTLGSWTQVTWDLSATNVTGAGDDTGLLADVKRLHFRVGGDDVGATVVVSIDDYAQGSLSSGGAYVDEAPPGNAVFADAVHNDGGATTVASDGTGTYATLGPEVVRWDGTGSGKVYSGTPAGGDYVLATDVGLAYTSPGYGIDKASTDMGGSSESASLTITRDSQGGDFGTGADSATLNTIAAAGAKKGVDSGSATDTAAVRKHLFGSDAGTGADTHVLFRQSLDDADSGSTTETATLTTVAPGAADILGSDGGVVADAASLSISVELYRFRTPTEELPRMTDTYGEQSMKQFWERVEGAKRGLNVWKINGEWHTGYPSVPEVNDAEKYYNGGHVHLVDAEEAQELVNAGYVVEGYGS